MASEKFDFSVIFKVVNNASSALSRIGSNFSKLALKAKKVAGALKNIGAKATAAGKKLAKVGKKLTNKITLPLVGLGLVSLKASADIETMEVAFTSLTGSADKAKEVVKGLVDFTAKTPFQLEGVGKAAKQLMAAGVETNVLQDRLKFLGDIAAGANIPLSDMAQIFAKSKAKGKAMTEEILQLSDRGIPIIAVLSKQLGVSKNEIFKMASKSKISFDILMKALKSMSSEGGVFANQMEKQSNTMTGIFSTLKDNIFLFLASIGEELEKTFQIKEGMKKFIKFLQGLTTRFKALSPFAKKIIFIIVAIIAAIPPLITALGLLSIAMGTLSTVSLPITGTILAIAAGIAALTYGIVFLIKNWDDLLGGFRKLGPVGKIIILLLGPIMLFVAQIKVFISIVKKIPAVITIVKNAFMAFGEFVSEIVSNITGFFSMLKEKIPAFIGKKLGFVTNGLGGAKEAASAQSSETVVKVLVQAAEKSTATIEDVTKKKGNAKVESRTNNVLQPQLFTARGGVRI